MKIRFILLLALAIFLTGAHSGKMSGKLLLDVKNIRSTDGMIWVGIYNSPSNYLQKEKAIVKGFHIRQTGSVLIPLDDMPYGEYAIAIFHDENNNGELDRTLIGIPSEPYAFSRKPSSKWRIPDFREIQFHFNQDNQHLLLQLEKWWD